jgi:hypothetical protein
MQTGMAMAAMIIDKHNQFSYAKTCLQAFLLECGRSEGILQSDSEEYLIALVRATAKACGNMAVRFSPAYSSQSNGNVERYHRTQSGQIRTLREQVQQNYSIQIPTDHPLMAIAVRHSAYLINRFLIKADGCTSYQARWGRTHNAALCEFGETVMYMVPTLRQRPKLEPRFFRGTWLGKCTSTGEPFVGVAGRWVRARIVRRLAGEARYDKQMLGTVKGTPWNPSPPLGFQPSFLLPPLPALSSAESEFFAIGTGATEALHLKNFRGEILTNKISLKIHTDSSSGQSMATRIGVSKRAKHIELRYMFIQHLIHDGILAIHKINTKHNPSFHRIAEELHRYRSFTYQHTNTYV